MGRFLGSTRVLAHLCRRNEPELLTGCSAMSTGGIVATTEDSNTMLYERGFLLGVVPFSKEHVQMLVD